MSAHTSLFKAMEKLLTAAEIRNWQPYQLDDNRSSPLDSARQRMIRAGQWAPSQMIGRRMAIGCVALEITQRCNLDCSYCYLSESSEALRDIPVDEVFRRIDLVHAHYGPNTDVQVTGGDPTLRDRRELVEIVRYIRGNFDQVPAIVKFFIEHADVVRLASFQVGAAIGRGTGRDRFTVTADRVMAAISRGAGTALNFGAAAAGHAECNRYAYGLIVNGKMHDFLHDAEFVQEVLDSSAQLSFDRANKPRLAHTIASYLLLHPGHARGIIARLAKLAWSIRRDGVSLPLKVGKPSFFVHNFMDATMLDGARCAACSFMVMTPEGPLSMCVHNAKRDDYLLQPAKVGRGNKVLFFNPVTCLLEDRIPPKLAVRLNQKNARGRAKHGCADERYARAAEPTRP